MQDPYFYKILFLIICFSIANLIFTDTFSIYQLVSNPVNIGVFRSKKTQGVPDSASSENASFEFHDLLFMQ